MKKKIIELTDGIQFIKQSKNALIIFSMAFIFGLGCNARTSVVKIGLVTDTHYDRVIFPDRLTVAQNLVNTFNSEKVKLVLGLGDIYEGHFDNLQDYLDDRVLYEVPWLSSKAPVYWVLGNHDNWGITDTQYLSNDSFIHSRNYTIDLDSNWRIIIYANGDGHYFSANPTSLTWLQNALEQARLEGKKIIIAIHVRIDQDYPGNPPSYTTKPTYSSFSFNASQQREIINTAKANGSNIKYVFQGHDHKNVKATVNGIDYYTFKNTGSDGSAAIIDIQDDDTLIITGLGSQTSYK
jgi:predicted phosphodiesterase